MEHGAEKKRNYPVESGIEKTSHVMPTTMSLFVGIEKDSTSYFGFNVFSNQILITYLTIKYILKEEQKVIFFSFFQRV